MVPPCFLSQSFLDTLPPLLLKEKMGEMPGAGQSHLIFGTGSTGCVTINQPSKPCCANAFYKLLENLDAIALMPGATLRCFPLSIFMKYRTLLYLFYLSYQKKISVPIRNESHNCWLFRFIFPNDRVF
jgi:hypothetical protein